jgi:myo-inositol 2-dehydrogenase / D-chiro-inositol 1-dehydrogenase
MPNTLKVGMISFAHGHAFSYFDALQALPEAVIAGIADPLYGRVESLVAAHGISYYEDYRDLLETDIDAVVICSENKYHAEITLAAAKKGKHVLCEKPLGLSLHEMQAMIDACRENRVQLMTAFPCRYLAAAAEAKKAIERGDIGTIVAIKGTNRGSLPGGWFVDPELSGGGALLDHTVHVMDLMNWLVPSDVREVYACAATLFNPELQVEDAGMMHVKFENGVFGVIDTSWSRKPPFPTWGDVTMEIIGTDGVIAIDGFAQKNELYSAEVGKGSWQYWGDPMDAHMVRDFVRAVLDDAAVPISGEDGLRSAKVALAGYQSIAAKQPVQL